MTHQARDEHWFAYTMMTCLLAALSLLPASTAVAQICDPDPLPPATVFADTLLLPDPVWTMTSFYPVAGTHLDQVGSPYYDLESAFTLFGIPAETDETTGEPAHFFLPPGWRTRDMISFQWSRPQGTQIVREPTLRSGGLWVQDPAAGATADDTLSISPRITMYGQYDGDRDQRFTFEFSFGSRLMGDRILSELDPGLAAWHIDTYAINDTLWYDHPLYANTLSDSVFDVGDTLRLTTTISWKENYGPDPEFGFALGDELLDGKINLFNDYLRLAVDDIELLDTNIQCAHGLFPDAWYPSGDYDPETDPSAYGLFVSFSPGTFNENFRWSLVVEEFEGYLIWRRVLGGGQTWSNTWKISRNEERDKSYWWWIGGEFNPNALPPYFGYDGATLTPVFGQTDERVYLDFDVHNGFEYAYALTSFDRGFRPNSGEGNHYILSSIPKEELDDVARTAVFNKPAGEILSRRLYPVPNPLRSGKSAFDDPNYHNFPNNVVRFVGVTESTILKIFTLSGDLIFEGENTDPDTRNLIWDTRNQMGELVASGVYIYRAEGEGSDEEFGKLVIIR